MLSSMGGTGGSLNEQDSLCATLYPVWAHLRVDSGRFQDFLKLVFGSEPFRGEMIRPWKVNPISRHPLLSAAPQTRCIKSCIGRKFIIKI
jgi:hypothetical protein